MAMLLRIAIRIYLNGLLVLRRHTGSGPFGANGARALESPVRPGDNLLKTALYRHHVKQYHEASCSVASVVSVLNAARAAQGRKEKPVGQKEILEKVRTGHWKERMSPGGHRGRRGLPLQLLGEVVQASLDAYQIPYVTVEAVRMPRRPGPAGPIQDILRQRLEGFETRGDGLVIAHFDQGVFCTTLNIPHISPVGGFDPATGDVVVLDVDPDQPGPYRVCFQTFCRGLSSNYNFVFAPFGYGAGGYVYLRLK